MSNQLTYAVIVHILALGHSSPPPLTHRSPPSFIQTTYPPIDPKSLPYFHPIDIRRIPTIAEHEVYNQLISLKISKASPRNNLPKRLIKEFAVEIAGPLAYIYNISIIKGILPSIWKLGNIIPLPKKNPISDLGDIRPITLTPDFGKVFEHFLAKWIMSDVVNNIDKFQYGNIKGCSTSHYLIKLLDDVYKGIDKPNNLALITLVDFRKAFDLVDHSVAIRELFSLGCRYSLLPFVIF